MLVALAVVACTAPEPSPPTRAPRLAASAWPGTPLSGPRDTVPDDPDTWRFLGLRATSLSSEWSDAADDTDSPTVAAHATLIRRPGTVDAFEPFSVLGEWLRVSPASLAPWTSAEGLESTAWFAVAPGTTTEVRVSPADTVEVALLVGLDAATAEPSLAVRAHRHDVGTVWLALDVAPQVDGATLSLLIPSWPSDSGTDPISVRARLTSSPPSEVDRDVLVAQYHARIVASDVEPDHVEPITNVEQSSPWASLDEALDAVDHPATRRSALVYLGAVTGARLTEHVALVARPDLLRDIAAVLEGNKDLPSRSLLPLVLEHATVAVLADRDRLDGPLYAVVVHWAGAGTDALDAIEELMLGMVSLSDLDALLVSENVYALDDASPALRLRAYEWLEARGRAPDDYPVLGDADARRAALEAWGGDR